MTITKRRVTMRTTTTIVHEDGSTTTIAQEAVDYVPDGLLPAYVEDAATRWSSVQVSSEPDAGPGGVDGSTFVPDHLRAGTVPAINEKEK